ncbi:hypothetical protein [Burkholderia orbicola]|uniref:hypothetical protein n=1 Tax=Burkholderia orbicola TaxID=2978683 RepID=UPI0026504D61|nr:hypothetical protein [Burkholderia orbicola]MDN7559110.1 hypothetical protein [Burkholderia orbicola]
MARQIEQFLPRLRNGAVIAIDSQWGTVKLGLAFINAFEQDYTEDPFLPIAAELSALLDSADGRGKKLVKKAAAVAAACLPLGAKAAVSMGSKFVFGGLPTSCRAGVVIGSRWCGRRGRLFRATGGICQSAP